MTEPNYDLIGACGVDCETCDIWKLPFDAEAAERMVAWYRQQGWLKEHEGVADALERKMYCRGCRGERSAHWSPECWILKCCVDDKRLRFCSECESFPCERLVEWSKQNNKYTQALQRLHKMSTRQ